MSQPNGVSRSRRRAALIAFGVVFAVFPDVFVAGGSFLNSQVLGLFPPKAETTSWLLESEDRRVVDGYRDLGSSAWQLEPAQHFLSYCLREGESPYWNPFSAAGVHGPERLASTSFSIFVLLTALLGAGSFAFHAVRLGALVVAVYCLHRSLTDHLGRSTLAATAASFAFLLVGFHTSMLGAQMVHPYLLAPILLLASLRQSRRPTRRGFLVMVLAHVPLLLETFVPTTVLTLVAVHSICLVAGSRTWTTYRDGVSQWVRQGTAAGLGLLLLAPLWFPIVESIPLSDWDHYESRRFETVQKVAALGVATPKHFWESYGAFAHTRTFDSSELKLTRIDTTRVYHLGVIGLFVASLALADRRRPFPRVVLVASLLVLVGLGRTFGFPPFHWIHDLPLFGSFSVQYWGLIVALGFVLLVAFGVDNLESDLVARWPPLLVGLGILCCFFFLLGRLGFPSETVPRGHVLILLGTLAFVLVAFSLLHHRPTLARSITLCIVVAMVGEWVYEMNRLRPVRIEQEPTEIPLFRELRNELSEGQRVMNIGPADLFPNWGAALQIPQVDSLDGVNLAWYSRFFRERFGNQDQFLTVRGTGDPTRFDVAASDLLGVRFALVSRRSPALGELLESHGWTTLRPTPRGRVLENPTPYPRVFAVPGLVEAPGIPADWGLDGRRVATTTDGRLLARAREIGVPRQPEPATSSVPEVRRVRSGNTRVEIEVETPRAVIVVLADTWHPSWRAEVDGEPEVLGRVDDVLRGVAVPAGTHRITMTYRPRSLPAGLLVSLSTLLALGGWFFVGARRHPRSVDVAESP